MGTGEVFTENRESYTISLSPKPLENMDAIDLRWWAKNMAISRQCPECKGSCKNKKGDSCKKCIGRGKIHVLIIDPRDMGKIGHRYRKMCNMAIPCRDGHDLSSISQVKDFLNNTNHIPWENRKKSPENYSHIQLQVQRPNQTSPHRRGPHSARPLRPHELSHGRHHDPVRDCPPQTPPPEKPPPW